ncbi:hypothetical protein ACPOL_0301 [Acidisarcina polymorpha]|uniref:Uncharacterized protein n=1 Tax=Acidisarcina polymorpha TaxID=2211140 RepID=A0A2Z5FT64_9BACT|nr:hypothetical protein ACPOL_0301 [Acidisarcina polymorpha]
MGNLCAGLRLGGHLGNHLVLPLFGDALSIPEFPEPLLRVVRRYVHMVGFSLWKLWNGSENPAKESVLHIRMNRMVSSVN